MNNDNLMDYDALKLQMKQAGVDEKDIILPTFEQPKQSDHDVIVEQQEIPANHLPPVMTASQQSPAAQMGIKVQQHIPEQTQESSKMFEGDSPLNDEMKEEMQKLQEALELSRQIPDFDPREASDYGSKEMKDEPKAGFTEAWGAFAQKPKEKKTVGFPIRIFGRTWLVSTVEHWMKAEMEKWVRSKHLEVLDLFTDVLQKREYYANYAERFAAGEFNWGGVAVTAAIQSSQGGTFLLKMLLDVCENPEPITMDLVEDMVTADEQQCAGALVWAWTKEIVERKKQAVMKRIPSQLPQHN